LGTRLTDGLGGDDADRFTDVHLVTARQVAAVAHRADAASCLARERRTDDDLFDAGFFDAGHCSLVEQGARAYDDVATDRVNDLLQRRTTEHAFTKCLNHFTRFFELGHADTVERAAIELADHAVLSHVDQAAREVTRVRRLESRVRQALTRAVSRGEVLEHAQTLTEVRRNRLLDDLTRRASHQAAHSSQLTHLLGRTTSAR